MEKETMTSVIVMNANNLLEWKLSPIKLSHDSFRATKHTARVGLGLTPTWGKLQSASYWLRRASCLLWPRLREGGLGWCLRPILELCSPGPHSTAIVSLPVTPLQRKLIHAFKHFLIPSSILLRRFGLTVNALLPPSLLPPPPITHLLSKIRPLPSGILGLMRLKGVN